MLRPERGPLYKLIQKLFGKGANTDIEPEFIGDGVYRDAQNMRQVSGTGATGSASKVGGEQVLYPANFPNFQNYVCIGACVVTSRRVEFWASRQPLTDPVIIRINGVVMVSSLLIPYVWDKPLQFGDVSKCTGGIIFPADHFSIPLFWDINDIETAYNNGSTLYTTSFSLQTNTVGTSFPPMWLVQDIQEPLINTSVGAPAGQYAFAIRGVTISGDRSNTGPPTPLMSVPLIWDQPRDNAYPGGRTTGGPTDLLNPTPYSIKMRYRVDNYQGYDALEIIVRKYNDGGGLTNAGAEEVCARIQLTQGQFGEYVFIYPQDANIVDPIPPDESQIEQIAFTAPKTVEYVDSRVVYGNIQLESRIAALTFRTNASGDTMVPITKRITTKLPTGDINDGYSNPYHNTYNKSACRGERYGMGILPWDSLSGKGPVVPITGAENFQFPNRRDVKAGDSLTYSTDPIHAANVNCWSAEPVTPTFDAFSQGVFRKSDTSTLVNVYSVNGAGPYAPLRPTSPTDPQDSGYNIPPQTFRKLNFSLGTVYPETGNIHAPMNHAIGGLIYGVTNRPSWMKGFTVMRTEPAGRVVAHGMGMYRFQANPVNNVLPIERAVNEFIFHSKDMESDVIPQTTIQDIEDNPTKYEVQCVAPVGFHTDIYNSLPLTLSGTPQNPGAFGIEPSEYASLLQYGIFTNPFTDLRDICVGAEMLSYAGIQHDEGQINTGTTAAGTAGFQPGPLSTSPPGNWVGYSRWRNSTDGANAYWSSLDPNGNQRNGNTGLLLSSFTRINEGRGVNYQIRFQNIVYGNQSVGGSIDFNNQNVKNFHQPFYVANIILDGKNVPQIGSQQYISTGQHIREESPIGIIGTDPIQTFRLINERIEDCLGFSPTEYRYVYILDANGSEQAWVCRTGNTLLPVATVIQDIANNGFWVGPNGIQVYGLYEAYTDQYGNNFVEFGSNSNALPAIDTRVIVKYDDTAPIRAFGFDRVIGRTLFMPVDRTLNVGGTNNALRIGGLPLPYNGFEYNSQYKIFLGTSLAQSVNSRFIYTLRQWAVLWDAEMLTPGPLDLFSSPYYTAFPRSHHRLHPYGNIDTTSAVANNYHGQYDNDYPGEVAILAEGGLRFTRSVNLDYSKKDKVIGVGVPIGYIEKLDQCNAHIASEKLDPLQQDAPGLRTFGKSGLFFISEESGEIKHIKSLNSGGNQKLYGWTEKGCYLIPYNQNILSGISGEVIGTQASDAFWPRQEMWLSRGQKGMPAQFWRLAAKAHSPTGQGDNDSVLWADRSGVYRLVGDSISDIARNKYMSELSPFLNGNAGNYTDPMCSMYNNVHDEYWFSLIGPPVPGQTTRGVPTVFVYNVRNGEWTGKFTYQFDRYLMDQFTMMGMRRGDTFELDKGFIMNGNAIPAWIETPYSPFSPMQSEAVTFRVSPDKPTKIEIRDSNGFTMFHTDQATNGQYWIKFIDGWQQQVGRRNAIYDPTQKRVQDRLFYKRIHHTDPVPFRITFSQLDIKQIP